MSPPPRRPARNTKNLDAKDSIESPEYRAGAVILAAGRGVRMQSALPKVLHTVGGVPMVLRVLECVRQAGIGRIAVVVDQPNGPIVEALPRDVVIAVQKTPGGTGDATMIGLRALGAAPSVVAVLGGDTPLITPGTLRAVLRAVRDGPGVPVALAAATRDDPHGYGRLVLSASGHVLRIVEETDASPEERLIRLVNGMVFAFDGPWLKRMVGTIEQAANGERYLTALIARAADAGGAVVAIPTVDQWEVMGVNSRRELAQAEAARRQRAVERLMDSGVTIVDPSSTYVDDSVQVGQDVVIHPQTYLRGRTVIGPGCELGPGAEIIDSRLGVETHVSWSVVEGAETGARVRIGPYCRIRPDTVLADDVALGSFGEVKNSRVGAGTQMHHFGYLGDTDTGANVNVGAGVVTCNYDGEAKHRTSIGANAFVGSDTMLIAPVRMGDGSSTGAGAVVTRDVPDGALVVGAPARRIERRPRRAAASPPGTESTREH